MRNSTTAAVPISTLRLMRVTGRGCARSSRGSGATLLSGAVGSLGIVRVGRGHWVTSRQTASVRTMRTTRCGLRAQPQLGGGEQPVDDVGGAAHAVVDQRRLGVGADHEQRRRLALGEPGRELDVDLGPVVEHLPRLPGRVALDAVAELDLLDVEPVSATTVPATSASARCFLRAMQLVRRVGPRHGGHVGLLGGAHLQVVGAPVGGDDEVGLQLGADRLDQDVHLRGLALAAGGVADHPAHGVAGRHGDELLAGLQRDVGDLVGGGVELVEGALGVGIDLDGIDVAVLHRIDLGERIGFRHALLGLLVVLGPVLLLRDRLQLARQGQGLRHLDDLDRRLLVRLALRRLERDALVEDGDLRHLDPRRAGGERQQECREKRNGAGCSHFGSPEVTSCDQLKACT